MNRKFVFFYVVSPVLLAAMFVAFQSYADKSRGAPDALFKQAELIAEVRQLIKTFHVDDVADDALLDGALKGMVRELGDAYSQYLDPEAYEAMNADNDGHFGGLGVRITLEDGVLTVISPIAGTPAARAGLRPGDKIVAIEGESTENFGTMDAVRVLRGEPGTKVTITILRKDRDPFEVSITREEIKVASVKWPRIVDQELGVGQISLIQFQEKTDEELRAAIERLREQGMKALVLDLRFNPGGLLDQAHKVTDLFVEEGIIVTTKGRTSQSDDERRATQRDTLTDLPVVVLINGGSASASEIVAGALQDHRRALIVGDRSYGKGSVQSIIPLRDKRRGVKLTTAYYYTPSGRNISRTKESRGGISPDIPVALTAAEVGKLAEHRSELDVVDPSNPDKRPAVYVDRQLQAAIDAIKGKRVYSPLK